MSQIEITHIDEIPSMGSRVVKIGDLEIALFKTRANEVFAIENLCPHKQGKLAEGLVHDSKVTCPLHNWVIDLDSGEALGNDHGCSKTFTTIINDGIVSINL